MSSKAENQINEQTIRCRDCDKQLMNYFVYDEDIQVTHTLVCDCPFCGGQSMPTTIEGMLNYGPIPGEQGKPTLIKDYRLVSNEGKSSYTWRVEVVKDARI
jgi:hypothetical protein